MYQLSWDNKYEIQRVTFVPVGNRFAEIDLEDYRRVSVYKWHLQRKPNGSKLYAATNIKRGSLTRSLLMHRLILNTRRGLKTDHKDHDGLNNTKSNLRLATHAENTRYQRVQRRSKSSHYKGVHWNGRCWVSRIKVNNNSIYLGCYRAEGRAANAYNEAAKKHFGEFAVLNEIHIPEVEHG